jgi:hypothetical protein
MALVSSAVLSTVNNLHACRMPLVAVVWIVTVVLMCSTVRHAATHPGVHEVHVAAALPPGTRSLCMRHSLLATGLVPAAQGGTGGGAFLSDVYILGGWHYVVQYTGLQLTM